MMKEGRREKRKTEEVRQLGGESKGEDENEEKGEEGRRKARMRQAANTQYHTSCHYKLVSFREESRNGPEETFRS